MDESSLDEIVRDLDIPSASLDSPYKPNGTQRLQIELTHDIKVARNWDTWQGPGLMQLTFRKILGTV